MSTENPVGLAEAQRFLARAGAQDPRALRGAFRSYWVAGWRSGHPHRGLALGAAAVGLGLLLPLLAWVAL